MSELEEPVDIEDPFSPDNVNAFILITMMRLYDVGMAILNNIDHDASNKLHEMHSQGKVLGSYPWIDAQE